MSSSVPISSQAGIKRDGTPLDGNFYTDGQWCRFRLGRPKKIGGYRELINLSSVNVPSNVPIGPMRGMYLTTSHGVFLHALHGMGILQIPVDLSGFGGTVVDRTPAAAAWGTADDKSMSTAALYDSVGLNIVLIAHGARDLLDITSDVATPVFYGIDEAATALVTTTKSVSGGACVIGPFVFAYGSNGEIANCDTNRPNIWTGGKANAAFPASTKVVAGLPLRGGANAPAGLFWSLAELIRVSFIGGTAIWRYDILTDQSSIMGKQAVVEYDGVYYWPGIDRFLLFNGVMKELPNALNQDFFFDNINFAHRNKCWGMRVSRWGEIWWFFPKYPATECNWAVIYNVRENTWYDTPIPTGGGRTSGLGARELPLIFMADSVVNTASSGGVNGWRIFQHETGADAVINGQQLAIPSYFETSRLGIATSGAHGQQQPPNVQTRVVNLEPDFVQAGSVTVTVKGVSYPHDATVQSSDAKTFDASQPSGLVSLRSQYRIPWLRFESNEQGGDFHMGKTHVQLEAGDERG